MMCARIVERFTLPKHRSLWMPIKVADQVRLIA